MSTGEFHSAFVSRFNDIWARARRVQLSQALCWAILTVLAGLSLLAAADYWLELSRAARIGAVFTIGFSALAVAITLALRSFRRWQRQATAATIEHVFPQLGQRIRTTVECAAMTDRQLSDSGLATSLVAALDDDTVRRAQPLPLDAVIPWKSLALTSLAAAALGLGLALASALSWEWRAAAGRAFLGEQPYTEIFVEPGDAVVKEGESLAIQIKVRGRTGGRVSFLSRRTDEDAAPWRDELLPLDKSHGTADREASFEVALDHIRHPLEYRVAAGTTESNVYQVKVLYPLKIVRQQATIEPPAYTRQQASTVEQGDITALIGSHLQLKIELDRAPESAWLEMRTLARRFPGEEPPIERLPLTIEGTSLSAGLDLTSDQTYSIVATSADGMELLPNNFRLRARPDEPPQVWFDSPSEAIEVHTLAEILMRIRASDDFGLSRSGIMFEINNEEEYPLLAKDFEQAAEELRTTGTLLPQTRATLEKVLPLEHFQLSQHDSVMYYAFAEDIKPGQAQRTETDLRFIDIRPFRRNYRERDLPDGQGQGRQFKSLEEIISRQRYALNRTIQLDRQQKHTGRPDLSATDALVKFEGEVAQATRDLAEGLMQRGFDETELLFQAETAMLAAADSLSGGNFDTATLQMREALKSLIEGRNRLEIALFKRRDRQMLADLRRFDRTQAQKLRRPKSDEQQARQISQRLEELAREEESICDCIGQCMKGATSSSGSGTNPSQVGEPKDSKSPSPGGEGAKTGLTKEELEDRQLDVAAEAREIEKALAKAAKATDLAKQRMADGAKQAEDAAEALARSALDEAKTKAEAAGDQFRELATQVKSLLARDQAERIASAQQMAAQLARQQQQFANRLSSEVQSFGQGGPPPNATQQMSALGGLARYLAAKAQTLADVLNATSKADVPGDLKSANDVARITKALDLKGVTDRLGQLPSQIENGKLQQARAMAADGAERMESAAEQLGVVHRSIVAPRVQELAELEQQVGQLEKQLDKLDTDPRITAWHVEADELLGKIDEIGIDDPSLTELRDEMREAGWSGDIARNRWAWDRTIGGSYIAPGPYRLLLARVAETLRSRMQEYLLGNTQATGDEPIPPQYQDFVDRYYRVLAAERKATGRPPANDAKGK